MSHCYPVSSNHSSKEASISSDWGACKAASGHDADQLMSPRVEAHPSWTGVPMMVMGLPGHAEARDMMVFQPSLVMALSGRGKRRYARGRRTFDLYSSPEMFELYSVEDCIDRASWNGESGEVLCIQLPHSMVSRLISGDQQEFRLPTAHEKFDRHVTDLMRLLWAEARDGGPRGRLYSEGITLALLGLLGDRHGASQLTALRSDARLSAAEQIRIRDHIEAHLASDLSVSELAQTVRRSPGHFSKAFKATFEMSPHAYVTDRRIQHAIERLQTQPDVRLCELAIDLGFSSQPHFTTVFRQKLGVTPGKWRAI